MNLGPRSFLDRWMTLPWLHAICGNAPGFDPELYQHFWIRYYIVLYDTWNISHTSSWVPQSWWSCHYISSNRLHILPCLKFYPLRVFWSRKSDLAGFFSHFVGWLSHQNTIKHPFMEDFPWISTTRGRSADRFASSWTVRRKIPRM